MASIKEQFHRLHPREYANFTYAYPVLSRRSGGVSLGVNLNLDKFCNFDCPYCQVDRTTPGREQKLDLPRIREEVEALLQSVDSGGVCRLAIFDAVPDSDKKLRDVALSGDGEPTMVPEFPDVCALLHEIQAGHPALDFKLVLITNATLLDRPKVRAGVEALLALRGEVWAKLDAGTEDWFQRVNVSRVSLDRIESNLIELGRSSPFKVQSFFGRMKGAEGSGARQGWDAAEVEAYLQRLTRIRDSGARILEVQLYTLARPPSDAHVTAVDKTFLENMRARIEALDIPARVYGGD
jgi:wyosine [tRNA(Phe)-imidazoG37] synthetase (radical SAM superfamily)